MVSKYWKTSRAFEGELFRRLEEKLEIFQVKNFDWCDFELNGTYSILEHANHVLFHVVAS